MESLSTGIEGLDMLIDGGYPKGKSILVTGPPGCRENYSRDSFPAQELQGRQEMYTDPYKRAYGRYPQPVPKPQP